MDPAHLRAQRPVTRQRQPHAQGEVGHPVMAAPQEQRVDCPVPVTLVLHPAVPAHTAAQLLQAQPCAHAAAPQVHHGFRYRTITHPPQARQALEVHRRCFMHESTAHHGAAQVVPVHCEFVHPRVLERQAERTALAQRDAPLQQRPRRAAQRLRAQAAAQAVALAMQARAQRVRAGLPGQPGLHRQPAAVQAAVIGMQAGAALQRAIGRPGPARAGAQHGVGIAAPDAIGRQWQHLVAVCGHHHAGQASGAVDVAVVAQRGFHVGPAAAGGRRAGAMGAPWLCGSGASACRAWARWRASRAPRASPAAAAARASCCQCATWRGCTTTRRRRAYTARCGSPQARAARASSKAHAQRRAGGWAVARVLGT